MTSASMKNDEMDEPHPYMGAKFIFSPKNNERYPLGDLSFRPKIIVTAENSLSPQLINEYGWVWLWRDGTPSKLTLPLYQKYLGPNSSVQQRRLFQVYWLSLETEWLRSNKYFAGVLAFCYLTNNYGYTGDWFTGNIKDLKPSPTLASLRLSFAPVNVFLNLADERYIPTAGERPQGKLLDLNCIGVNDLHESITGNIRLAILDAQGNTIETKIVKTTLQAENRTSIHTDIKLPVKPGGYLLLSRAQGA